MTFAGTATTVEVLKHQIHPQHPPAPEEVIALKAYSAMKRKATEHPEAPPAQILRTELPNVPSPARLYLPERQTMKRTFNRRRQRAFPVNPKTLQDLDEIPDEFKLTMAKKKKFLCYDSYFDDEDDEARRKKRILLFASKSSLQALSASPVLHFDGTFETAPDIFAQIVTIHGEYRNETFPYVYSLLPDKTEDSYRRLISAVFQACEDYGIAHPTPTTCIMDLEKGLINAVLAEFEDVEIRLCLFHLRQAAFRKIIELGLMPAFRAPEDDSVRKGFRQIVGTAFVPTEDVVQAFLEARAALPHSMAAFADYFETNYVMGRRARGNRRPPAPRYPPRQWNQHIAAREKLSRTNNATEAWHNRFQACDL